MPDIDIYVDSSFFSVVSGTRDVYSAFYAGQLENIGQRDTTVDYSVSSEISGTIFAPVEVYVTYSGAQQDGFKSTAHKFETNATISGMEVALIDYSLPITSSGLSKTEDFDLEYSTGISKISGSLDARTKFTAGQLYDYSDNILANYWTFAAEDVEQDYEADYTAGGHYDPLIPGPPEDQVIISGTNDYTGYFTMGNDTNSGTIQQDMEVQFAGYPMEFFPEKYTYRFHSIAGIEGEKQIAEWEATVISGSVLDIPFNVLSTVTASGHYNTDEVCGLVDLGSYAFESETVSGTISYYFSETICAVSGTGSYGFDVDLFSLKISNFSLDVDEYTAASGMICVDITDDVHNVVVSGSYFIVDEAIVSGTSYTPIANGYTMCYDSPTDFDDLVGSTTITVHAANDNGDILEQNFYLTSGYIVEYDNRKQDYGFGSQVVVRGTAENLASCPDTGTDAYFFTTIPKYGADLAASITPIPFDRIVVTPSGVEIDAVIGTQQYTAEIYDIEDTIISGTTFTWNTTGGGTIDNNGFFTAGNELGIFTDVVVASFADTEGYASVEVKDIKTVYYYGKTFRVEVRAKDFAGNVMDPFTFEFRIEDKPE